MYIPNRSIRILISRIQWEFKDSLQVNRILGIGIWYHINNLG